MNVTPEIARFVQNVALNRRRRDPDDLAQEGILALVRAPEPDARGWHGYVLTIASRAMSEAMRRERVQTGARLGAQVEISEHDPEPWRESVIDALDELTAFEPWMRTYFQRRYYDGWRVDEIAHAFGLQTTTLTKRVQTRLRKRRAARLAVDDAPRSPSGRT